MTTERYPWYEVVDNNTPVLQGDFLLSCPVFIPSQGYNSVKEDETTSDFFKARKGKETLRQGNVPGYHLLNKCEIEGFRREYVVVDFRETYSLPIGLITDIAGKQEKRLRLLPPYREHLSQAYARFFMRVGLPVDIPRF